MLLWALPACTAAHSCCVRAEMQLDSAYENLMTKWLIIFLYFSHYIWRGWMNYSLPIRNSKFTFVSLCAFPVRVHLPVLLDRFSEKWIFNHADTFHYYSILGWRYLLYNTEEQTLLEFLIAWMFFTIHKHTWKEDKTQEVRTFESHSWMCYCSDLSIYHPLIFCLRNNSTDLLCKDPW